MGQITDDVYTLRDEFKLPGMRVMQFAFGDDLPLSPHAPHNYIDNCFAYTGTHDNNTTRGWYETDIDKSGRKLINAYTGQNIKAKNINKAIIRLCYSSVAKAVIIPIQDVLGLNGQSRMNIPSSANGNWLWRLKQDNTLDKAMKYLNELAVLYNR
ncbi:4-alpha-glucanotransferase [Mucilaginibacter gracilis]|uniref:4-alpha-glucanotransferase n=1 Tax=Mucilaginibacter gracilis TaxID=423350 RepID=UPI000EB42B87|nr:4-alpha-glucanotransferase [Mucilaginibacter gracilis]